MALVWRWPHAALGMSGIAAFGYDASGKLLAGAAELAAMSINSVKNDWCNTDENSVSF